MVSEVQGNVRASVYLGVMYMFGIGVEKNPKTGFAYMKKAADARDPFGMMYLAKFYRYGMGTNPDQNQGYVLMQNVLRMPTGLDVFGRARGTTLSGQEVAAATADGLSALTDDQACEQANATAKAGAAPGRPTEIRDCTQTPDWVLRLMKRLANHTVEHPEEILPEIFDPIIPPAYNDMRDRSAAGLVRLTP